MSEDALLETTRVWLPVASMIPEDVERELRALVGAAYPQLDELIRVILMLAHRSGGFSNEDVQQYRNEHPRDIGVRLAQLVASGWLKKDGHGRGTHYGLPARSAPDLLTLATPETPVETPEKAGGTTQETTQETRKTTQETTQEKILALLKAQPVLTRKELAARLGITDDGVKYHLRKLSAAGVIRHVGPTKAGHWEVLK